MSSGRLVPALPSCILDPLREEFLALLPPHIDEHPLGCHRRRIPDPVVFDKLVEILVYGAGYEPIADASCSATTLRRRRDEWIRLGVWDRLRLAALDAYDKMIGLDLADLAVDGCLTKAPCGGECAGRSPVDRAARAQALPARRRQRGAAHRAARAGQHPRPSAAAGHPGRLGRAAGAGRRRSSRDDGAPG